MKKSWIERMAESVGLVPALSEPGPATVAPGPLARGPRPEQWDDVVELDATAWPERVERHYSLIPTTCFNCEAACGLLAWIDKASNKVAKFEGNPLHPGSRGRNCAKGPATINQIHDPERILYPQKRAAGRGAGRWKVTSWDEALDDIAGRIRASLEAGHRDRVVYHVGRPGHEGYTDRVLKAWGVDGHNSHTNICSAGARTGYALWQGHDRPSPDHTNARVILLTSAHLEAGHYFNPHAQRIMEAKAKGAKLIVLDPRLSNTASIADYWLPVWPGSEAAIFLAIARIMLEEERYDRAFVETWTNWEAYLEARHPDVAVTFDNFIARVREEYAEFTPEFAAKESGLSVEQIVEVAGVIADAGSQLSAHVWRAASIGNLGGWQVARALHLLSVLTGSVGTRGGTLPNGWNKFKPTLFDDPPGPAAWNELHFPPEYTLSHYEMSQILPHMVKEGRGGMDVYFTRVFNPVWTYPDGFSWIEMLSDEQAVGCHIALTPTWNETAFFADYVLPMGHASERHDLNSYETQAGVWIAFRQPVLREKARREGREVTFTHEVNPGEVWEEDEFWIELSWRIDPDGSLGIRKHFESPYRPGEKITVEEYYRWIFEHVPGLPEKAAAEDLSPLDYMRRYGAFLVEGPKYQKNRDPVDDAATRGAEVGENGAVVKDGATVAVQVDGRNRVGFNTPSGRQEFYSPTLAAFGWEDQAIPGYIRSHVHPEQIDRNKGEFVLLPTFRLPTHIHSRSANSKWLAEIAHVNPVWINREDAARLGVTTGDCIKIETEIGWFVDRVWATEAVRPGIVACSHHIGRWRREEDSEQFGNRWMTNTVRITRPKKGVWRMETAAGVRPFASEDADTQRIWWRDGGVHQNITHAVHPDPISGAHCWLQKVRLSRPAADENYGDVQVDTNKSQAVFREWNQLAKERETHPDGLRRPLWLARPLTPQREFFYLDPERTDGVPPRPPRKKPASRKKPAPRRRASAPADTTPAGKKTPGKKTAGSKKTAARKKVVKKKVAKKKADGKPAAADKSVARKKVARKKTPSRKRRGGGSDADRS